MPKAHRLIGASVGAAVAGGAAALVVGRGGGIEPALVACLPDADHDSWGAPFGHRPGASLSFDQSRFVSIQFRQGTTRSVT